MGLTIDWIKGFNPFEFIVYPVCEGREFTSLSAATAWCDRSNCRFEVRDTAGKPGCVIDAFNDDCNMPHYLCVEGGCGGETTPLTYFEEPRCPEDPGREQDRPHEMIKSSDDGYVRPSRKTSWYINLEIGGDCSGWLRDSE